jgi:hypothetical protein
MAAAFEPGELLQGADWLRHVLLDNFIPPQPASDRPGSLPGSNMLQGGLDGGHLNWRHGFGDDAVKLRSLQQIQTPPLVGGPTALGQVNGPVSATAPPFNPGNYPRPGSMQGLGGGGGGGGFAPAAAGGGQGSEPAATVAATNPQTVVLPGGNTDGGGTVATPIPGAVWLLGSGLSVLALPGWRRIRRT